MVWFLALSIFLSLNAFGATNSLGLRGPEIGPKKTGVYRILLLGPGISHSGLANDKLPSVLLQNRLNSGCTDCYEVINGSVEGNFSTRNLLLLQDITNKIKPDLVVYYESGAFFSADLLERFRYNLDEESELPVAKSDKELYANPCCDFIFNLFKESTRREIALVINYLGTFKKSKEKSRKDLFTLSENNLRNFSRMGSFGPGSQTRFLVLLQTKAVRVDRTVFEDSLTQEILFKFLVYFYLPGKVPTKKLFYHQGFEFRILEGQTAELYSPPNLMYHHEYNLNSSGAQIWSEAAAKAIQKYRFGKSTDQDEDDY